MVVAKGTSLFANAKQARRLNSIMNSCRKDSSDTVLHQSETVIVFGRAGCRNRKSFSEGRTTTRWRARFEDR